MGKKLILAGTTFSDTALPVLPTYDMLESTGTLALFDVGNRYGAFSGLPANMEPVPNIFANQAADIIGGSATEASCQFVMRRTADLAGVFQAERTAKGGLHGMSTQGSSQTDVRYISILVPESLRAYMAANIANEFYVSAWFRLTRAQAGGSSAPQSHVHWAASTANYYYHTQNTFAGTPATVGTNKARYSFDDVHLLQLGVSAASGSGTTGRPVFGIGAADTWGSYNFNRAPSAILYRAYVEDLAVSGRSYADVQALDRNLFDAAFGAGGRFAGDTFSDPATTVP